MGSVASDSISTILADNFDVKTKASSGSFVKSSNVLMAFVRAGYVKLATRFPMYAKKSKWISVVLGTIHKGRPHERGGGGT